MQGEFIFEGKKYISASRASKIIGYTSDYIGQLCRKGSLDCRMVGRSWFVEEESLKTHKVVASSAPRGRIPMYQKNATSASTPVSGSVRQHAVKKASEATEFAFLSVQQNWKDYLDEEADRKQVLQFSGKVAGAVFALIVLFTASSVFISNKNQFVSNPISALRSYEKIGAVQNTASEFVSLLKSSQHEVHGSVSYSANVFGSLSESIQEKINGIRTHMYRGLARVNNFLFNATRKVRVLVMDTRNVEKSVNGGRDRTGVAVVPSSSDEVANERVKQYVADSFSDEAEIVPDESGNSGVIKPVFKENKDQEYVYVIVPVKENTN